MSDDDNKLAGDQNDDDEQEVEVEELTDEDKALAGIGSGDDDDDGDDDGDDGSSPTTTTTVAQSTFVTKEGLKKLKDELEHLENVKRREVAQRLKEAIAYGDLSENSEYQDAKEEQAFVEGRIAELHEMIKSAKIIAEKTGGKSVVRMGSTVTVQNLTDKDEPETYTIVGSTEASPLNNKISNESPIGAAVLEKGVGDEVIVKAPAGQFTYKIVKIK